MNDRTLRKPSQAAAGAALLACILALGPGPLTSATDVDDLQAIIDAPGTEELGRVLDAMVQTKAANEFWTMSIKPGAEATGEQYGEWFNGADIPSEILPWAIIAAGQRRSKGCVPRLMRYLQNPAAAGDAVR
jgi:hypothetical protein